MKDRRFIWILAVLCLSCGPDVADPFPEIVVHGPLENVDFLLDDRSVFEPLPNRAPSQAAMDDARAVFDFMRHHFTIFPLRTDQPLETYLFGFGAGLCGEQSRVMAALWNEQNLPAQLLALPRHTLAQVQVDQAWSLFDAQHHTDYSQIAGRPVDLDALQAGEFSMPGGLDPVGYDWAHMQDVLSAEETRYDVIGLQLSRPALILAENQTLRIRPRRANEPFPLPLLDIPGIRNRTDLVPGYFVRVSQELGAGEQTRFQIQLPLLNVDVPKGAIVEQSNPEGDWTAVDINSGENLGGLRFGTQTLQVQSEQPGTVTLTYALAAWVGDRLFSADSLVIPGVGILAPPTQPDAKVWVTLGQLPQPAEIGEATTLPVTLHWQNLTGKRPIPVTLHLERLGAGISMELNAALRTVKWTWKPAHGPSGSETIQIPFKVTAQSPVYRPSKWRTYQIRWIAPFIAAGRNHQAKRIQLQ